MNELSPQGPGRTFSPFASVTNNDMWLKFRHSNLEKLCHKFTCITNTFLSCLQSSIWLVFEPFWNFFQSNSGHTVHPAYEAAASIPTRVARWHIFKPKILIWVNFGGTCNGRCWYMLWTYKYMVYFPPFWYVLPRKIWQPWSRRGFGLNDCNRIRILFSSFLTSKSVRQAWHAMNVSVARIGSEKNDLKGRHKVPNV
jgi:hypothetical protein